MVVDEVSYRAIEIGKYFRNLSWWSWMLLRRKNNVRTIIVTAYCPTVSANAGGAYSQQIEAFKMMEIQNNPRTQFWIDLNTEIAKYINQGEHLLLMGDCNSE